MSEVDHTETAVEAPAPAQNAAMTVEEALQQVLKTSLLHDGLARGLRECGKALDRREARLCILSEACNEAVYVKLIEALCAEHKIHMIKVQDAKLLGQWAGLCKIDREGNPRKVVATSCVVIKDYGIDTEALSVIRAHLDSL